MMTLVPSFQVQRFAIASVFCTCLFKASHQAASLKGLKIANERKVKNL